MLLCSCTFVVCSVRVTSTVNPHTDFWLLSVGSGGDGGLAENRLFIKYQLKEKAATLLIGYDCSTSSTTFEHSSVALENIWRGRGKERNPRHKHVELGELTGSEDNLPTEAVASRNVHEHTAASTHSADHHLCSCSLYQPVSPATCRRLKAETETS